MRSAVIFLLVTVLGCGEGGKSEKIAKPQATNGSAAIHGVVRFVGMPPVMEDIPNAICAGTQRAIRQETVLVGPSGGLRNCLVYLKGVSVVSDGAKPQAVLDQVNCRYVPHMVAVIVGEPLVIKSSDATPHNVHLQTQVNPPANYAMVQPGQETTTRFAYPEIFKVTCDVHPWMAAWVGVFDSPYFAVTDEAGRFEIKNVPAGDYTLAVWQERLGEKQEPIHLTEHQTLEENFAYAPSAGSPGG
jgi:plastocyanin